MRLYSFGDGEGCACACWRAGVGERGASQECREDSEEVLEKVGEGWEACGCARDGVVGDVDVVGSSRMAILGCGESGIVWVGGW